MSNIVKMPKVELDETETNIINVLRKYTAYFNKTYVSDTQEPLTLRITGGWVRDKLLNHPSHDIDIGIDHMSGESFVNGLKEWLDVEHSNDHVDPNAQISKIHKIKMNPDKSKHLETCTTHLYGLDIDFVNLRSETYSIDSRIPVIEAGTPYEDAHRRDATLNSLFFNLSTLEVEDWTGKGIEDLKMGILRTPLEPRKTFLDDPLRCLRLIRFASTYNFDIDNDTLHAMSQPEIKDALDHKISRERIGVELKKIIMKGDVLMAMNLLKIVGFGNIWGVGDTPVDEQWLETEGKKAEMKAINSMNELVIKLPKVVESTLPPIIDIINTVLDVKFDDELEKVAFWAALVLHYWKNERIACISKKGRENYVAFWCVLNGIRMPLKVSDLVALVVRRRDEFVNDVQTTINQLNDTKRSQMAEKFIIPYQKHWKLNLVINYILDCFQDMDSIDQLNMQYNSLYNRLMELNLQECYSESLIVNGKEVLKLLQRKPGPWLKPFNEKLYVWQLDHPNCTKDEMIEYLKTLPVE